MHVWLIFPPIDPQSIDEHPAYTKQRKAHYLLNSLFCYYNYLNLNRYKKFICYEYMLRFYLIPLVYSTNTISGEGKYRRSLKSNPMACVCMQCFCESVFFAFWPVKSISRRDGSQSVRLPWRNKITPFEVFEESSQYTILRETLYWRI